LRLLVFNVTADTEIAPVFAALIEQGAGAVLIGGSTILNGPQSPGRQGTKRDQILSYAARFALPTLFSYSDDARAGGLLGYSTDLSEINRQMGAYAGRILKGEKPADLPVQFPTKVEFVINLKTAKALGLTIPPNLLALADEVIE
jgi:putative ABC transport system substrate-binding protein